MRARWGREGACCGREADASIFPWARTARMMDADSCHWSLENGPAVEFRGRGSLSGQTAGQALQLFILIVVVSPTISLFT